MSPEDMAANLTDCTIRIWKEGLEGGDELSLLDGLCLRGIKL